jgi:hypothetical protein
MAISILLPMEVVLGSVAGSSVSLTFGMPADRVYVSTSLVLSTKEEQCAVIRFLWSEGVKTAKIYCRLLLQYEDSCIAQRKVYEWLKLFRNGRTSVVDEQRRGRPWTAYAN